MAWIGGQLKLIDNCNRASLLPTTVLSAQCLSQAYEKNVPVFQATLSKSYDTGMLPLAVAI